MSSKTRKPTSGCCCLGVRCRCPPGKVCPSMKRDINHIREYIAQNNLNDEQASQYRRSLFKKSARKSKKKSARKSRKSPKRKSRSRK